MKTPEERQWRCSGVFQFERIYAFFYSFYIVDVEQVNVSWVTRVDLITF